MPSSRLVLTVLVAGPLACDPGPGADAPADIAAPNALDAEVDLPEAPIDLGEAIEIDLGDLGFTPLSLELGDFDGDGAIDLLITGVDGSVVTSATLRGLGDGTFEAPFDNGMSGCSAYPVVGRLSDDLRDDMILIVRAIREHGMRASMTTGGRNLTAARVEALAEAGLTNASVSIDGLEAEHDRLRGVTGSWRSAFAAIERLRAAGIPTAANTQINALTRHSLPALFEHLAAAGVFGWQLQITAPFGNAADHAEILLQPYDLLPLFEVLAELVPRVRAAGIKLWPANNLGYFGPLEAEMRVYQKRGAHYKGCGAGKYQIGIESDGTIKGCPSLGGPQNHAGNARAHALADRWRDAFALAYIRERTLDDLWGFCATCYYREPCRGGCTATAEPLLGRPGNNPFCHHRALAIHAQGLSLIHISEPTRPY